MRKLLQFCFCFELLFSVNYLFADELNQIATNNSLHNLHVNTIIQDQLGYTWIGTAKGLCRYNGYEYVHYYHHGDDPNSISNDVINMLLCDSQGRIWIATGSGLDMFDYNIGYFKHYLKEYASIASIFESGDNIYAIHSNSLSRQPKNGDEMSICVSYPSMILSSICSDGSKTWVAAKSNGNAQLSVLDEHMKPCMNPLTFKSTDIRCLFVHNEVLWVGTSHGIKLIDTKTGKPIEQTQEGLGSVQKFQNLSVTLVQKLSDSQIIIGTNNCGLFIYSLNNNTLTPHSQSSLFSNVDSQHITSFLKDNSGNLWVGTFDKGYYLEAHHKNPFNGDNILQNYLKGKFVSHISEDSHGNLLIATRIYGLIYYDKQRKTFKEYNNSNSMLFGDATTNFVERIFIDSQNRLWVGSDGQLTVCELSQGVFKPIKSYPINIVDIIEDANGNIWVGHSTNGIFIFKDLESAPHNLLFMPGPNNITKMVNIDRDSILCSSYSTGLYTVNINTLKFSAIKLPPEAYNLSRSIIYIHKDSTGLFWLGSYGNGIACYNMSDNSIRLYTPKDGLPSNDVLGIIRRGNNVWMSTSFGLARLSIKDDIFVNFYDYDGIGGNQFHEKSAYEAANGTIYFSGNHGLTFFNPRDISVPHSSIHVILENLKIFNNNVPIGKNPGVLERSLAETQSITLSHKQNVFSIDYVGIDFAMPQKINYAYKLENFDKDWNYVNNFRRASYSNLPPGEYQFCVKAQNQDGTWDNPNPTKLLIKVLYSPWVSPWALLLYTLTAILIIGSFIRLYIRNELNRDRLALSEIEKNHEKELTQMKMNFFANISHELRTPLTLIYGCANMLNNYKSNPVESSQMIGLINYNASRLLRLLGQILDYNKIQQDTLPLIISNNDLAPIVENVVGSYKYYAKEKNIELLTQMPQGPLPMFADFEKLDKVINNLVSNALKYTKEGGCILVIVEILDSRPEEFAIEAGASRYLKVRVEDNGIGMSPENIKHLFERHRRFINNHEEKKIDGFGIGLNYIKKLVLTHKGDIIATHNEPYGMIFSFAIPIDERSYSGSEFLQEAVSDDIFANEHIHGVPPTYVNHDTSNDTSEAISDIKKEYKVLVVEDNAEVRILICKILGQIYEVETAEDGKQGLEKINSVMPDVIISDVIMPHMNGFELCAQVKQNPEYCHIPIILLTARTGNKDQIEGYSLGADAYIEKPFYPELLTTIVRNQLERHERLKVLVASQTDIKDVPPEIGLNPLDKKFIDKLYEYIEAELSNESLNVNLLGKELGFSRSSFYRKVTVLTGQSPNDFLRIYRLNRAAELIVEGKYMMSEVAEMTGFGTYSSFTTGFKQQFGVSPRRYTSDKSIK